MSRARKQASFEATTYWAFVDGRAVPIRIGEGVPAIEERLGPGGEWFFITAWNPSSQVDTPPERNARAQVGLRDLVGAECSAFFDGFGLGDDTVRGRGHPPEPSLLVLGPLSTGRSLGRRFGQDAIVAGRRGERARLVWCEDELS